MRKYNGIHYFRNDAGVASAHWHCDFRPEVSGDAKELLERCRNLKEYGWLEDLFRLSDIAVAEGWLEEEKP